MAQQHRAAEVVRRKRPNMPRQTEHDDITGYCENCQTTYRIGLLMFYRIAESIDKEELLKHNIDIKIRHNRWQNGEQGNSALYDKKIIEHEYELFSHQLDDYLVHCGIQTYLPKGPHTLKCRYVTMEVDMPIRKEAAYSIREYTEKALHDIIRIAQDLHPNRISVIDQREAVHTIETKIKIVIGEPKQTIAMEPGWVRKETYYHGNPTRLLVQEATEQLQTPRSEIDRSAFDPTYWEEAAMETMEIDFEEASQPQGRSAVAKPEAIATDTVAEQTRPNAAATIRPPQYPRPRRATVPSETHPKEVRGPYRQGLFIHRRPDNPRISEQEAREARLRTPLRSRLTELRQEAQQEAEEDFER